MVIFLLLILGMFLLYGFSGLTIVFQMFVSSIPFIFLYWGLKWLVARYYKWRYNYEKI